MKVFPEQNNIPTREKIKKIMQDDLKLNSPNVVYVWSAHSKLNPPPTLKIPNNIPLQTMHGLSFLIWRWLQTKTILERNQMKF
jgi:hypothetical protein